MIVTALIGNPTGHSVSPELFKIYADENKLEYSHVKFDVLPENLPQAIKGISALGFAGANITLPYKMEVLKYLDKLSPEAVRIGAVNTIKNENGKLTGFNTDKYGAITAIESKLGRSIGERDKILLFGTGGAARAITVGFLEKRSKITVVCTLPFSDKSKTFVHDFKDQVSIVDNNDVSKISMDITASSIICNATSLGMKPEITGCVITRQLETIVLNEIPKMKDKLFFDAVFNPLNTRFLSLGSKLGAMTVSGIDMMIYQGTQAFKIWTGKEVSSDSIIKAREKLISLLQ